MKTLCTRLNLTLLLFLVAVTLAGFWLLPADKLLPAHWAIDGRATRYADKTQVLLQLPLVAAFVVAVALATLMLPRMKAAAQGHYQIAVCVAVALATFSALQVGTIAYGLGTEFDATRAAFAANGLGLMAIGNMLPKSRPVAREWPKFLREPSVWYRSTQLCGALLIVSGVALVVVTLADISNSQLSKLQLVANIAPSIIAIAYGYVIARRDPAQTPKP